MTLLARVRDVRTQCWEIVGYEPCCCGDRVCPDGGRGWPIWCHRPVSRLRWVLVGHCGQHGGRRV